MFVRKIRLGLGKVRFGLGLGIRNKGCLREEAPKRLGLGKVRLGLGFRYGNKQN